MRASGGGGAHPSSQVVVDDLANGITSLVSVGVRDGVPVDGSRWNCRLSCN